MESLLAALAYVLQPYHIGVIFFGTLIGILVGAMPGLSSIMGLSIMMPLTLSLEGNAGILMLLGVFCGAIYGGSITAILIKTPGTANSAATVLDIPWRPSWVSLVEPSVFPQWRPLLAACSVR